jgi:hypothetical protein
MTQTATDLREVDFSIFSIGLKPEKQLALDKIDQRKTDRLKENSWRIVKVAGATATIAFGLAAGTLLEISKASKAEQTDAAVSLIAAQQRLAKASSYTVQPGEGESAVASHIAPGRDARAVAYEIDHFLPDDASHKDHTLQPGDTVEYTGNGHIVGYEEVNHATSR